MLMVKVVFHRSAFRDPAAPYKQRFARMKKTDVIEVPRGRKLIPGKWTRIEGLARRILCVGYEGQIPVVHVL